MECESEIDEGARHALPLYCDVVAVPIAVYPAETIPHARIVVEQKFFIMVEPMHHFGCVGPVRVAQEHLDLCDEHVLVCNASYMPWQVVLVSFAKKNYFFQNKKKPQK